MATIFQKISGDNCVIISPGEALIYPFNLGDWTEIRIGGYFSYTTINDNNGTGIGELFPATAPSTNFFWGIKDTGIAFPYSSGCLFIGITNDSINSPKSALNNYSSSQPTYMGPSDSEGTRSACFVYLSGNTFFRSSALINGGSFSAIRVNEGTFVTGNTGYAWFNGLRYLYNRNSSRMTGYAMQDDSPSTDVSITGLQNNLSLMPNLCSPIASTLSGCSIRPDSIFLYNPLINNQIRIHSLCIDKYQ